MPTHRRHTTGRRAFTLLELLVVVVIIAVLIGLVASAGVAVLGNQKVRQAEDLLTTLDRALSEYLNERDGAPPPYSHVPSESRSIYENTPGTGYHPSAGGDNDLSNSDPWIDLPIPSGGTRLDPRHPDASVFLRQARGIGAVDAILAELSGRWLVATPETESTEPNAADATPSVLDPWAAPEAWFRPWPILGAQTVYYVHPSNEGAQRLYGRCVGGRPYFVSAGPDGRFGSTTEFSADGSRDAAFAADAARALEDNIYSYQPGDPDLSDDFNTNFR
jgi:prepilin-type N-terminal cleavage/methylation domain-containing protein